MAMDSLKGISVPVVAVAAGLVLLLVSTITPLTLGGYSIPAPTPISLRTFLGIFGFVLIVAPVVLHVWMNTRHQEPSHQMAETLEKSDDGTLLTESHGVKLQVAGVGQAGSTPDIRFIPQETVAQVGLTGFFPERHFYHTARQNRGNIDTYVATATKSVTIVSINLMTGLGFDELRHVIAEKLEARRVQFRATISLLDPRRDALMEAIAPVLDVTASALAAKIKESIHLLRQFKSTLSAEARDRLELRVHGALPFGSAIILDDGEAYGRIQIETKPYKAPHNKSFAFELAPVGPTSLYFSVVAGYAALLRDGERVGIDTAF